MNEPTSSEMMNKYFELKKERSRIKSLSKEDQHKEWDKLISDTLIKSKVDIKDIHKSIIDVLKHFEYAKVSAHLVAREIKSPFYSSRKIYEYFIERELDYLVSQGIIKSIESPVLRRNKVVRMSYLYYIK